MVFFSLENLSSIDSLCSITGSSAPRLPLGVGDLMQVVGRKEYLGRMGFVEWMDIEFVLMVETHGKKVLYFSGKFA